MNACLQALSVCFFFKCLDLWHIFNVLKKGAEVISIFHFAPLAKAEILHLVFIESKSYVKSRRAVLLHFVGNLIKRNRPCLVVKIVEIVYSVIRIILLSG